MKFKAIHIKSAMAALWCCMGVVNAQPIDPWLADGLNKQIQQNRNNAQGGTSGPSAAEVRAWHQRERAVQARIAKHRATPWYMAIAYDFANKNAAWAGGYPSEQRAVELVMKKCGDSSCKLMLVFSNACAVMTSPYAGVKSVNDIFFGIHPDDKQAAEISIKKCEAVHGKGNCAYSAMKTRNGTAFCVGYDYSVYGQE